VPQDEHYADCYDVVCECGRGTYHSCTCGSCYDCFLDRRADYAQCIYCDRWHSPEFDTCFQCSAQGRDEATRDLKLVILGRDGFRCRYCGVSEGDLQYDPRLLRPKCPPGCKAQHNHRYPCAERCGKRHKHRSARDYGTCQPDAVTPESVTTGCTREHDHLAKDDDGVRPARLHVDHIMPCAKGGTADPWNLQVLCGVCNIAKGGDWLSFSRHAKAREEVVSAYVTYLRDFLTSEEKGRLDREVDAGGGNVTVAERWEWVTDDYICRVKARSARCVPRASSGIAVEGLPAQHACAGQLPAGNGRKP